MRPSKIIGVLAVWATVLCLSSFAADKAPKGGPPVRIVHVTDYPQELSHKERDALLNAFATLGYVDGRNLELTTYDVASARAAESRTPTLPRAGDEFGPNPYAILFATTIPSMRPQVVLVSGPRAIAAAKESGLKTPVVFWRISDPVGLGLAASLGRPGGNLTGFSRATEKLAVKRLELLHEMLPSALVLAFVFVEDFPSHVRQADEVHAAAGKIGVKVREYSVPLAKWEPVELDALFATMRRDGIEGFLLPDTNVRPPVLIELAARYRLPTIYALTNMVTDFGGLAAYSTQTEKLEDVAGYAVRILRGERPGDLPVQESSRFEFVLNSRAARALDLTFPSAVLLRADAVIER